MDDKIYYVCLKYYNSEYMEIIDYVRVEKMKCKFILPEVSEPRGYYKTLEEAKYIRDMFNEYFAYVRTYDKYNNLITLDEEIEQDNIARAVILKVLSKERGTSILYSDDIMS